MLALKRSVLLSAVALFGLIAGLVFSAHTPTTLAQDDMGTITCDSTLVTLLYIAEHDYGFHSMLDVSTLDKGQYAPLFDEMMAMMEGDMASDDMTESDEDMAEDMSEDDMMEGMTMLTPGVVEGEDPFCTDLRAELDAFYYKTFTDMMMTEEGSN